MKQLRAKQTHYWTGREKACQLSAYVEPDNCSKKIQCDDAATAANVDYCVNRRSS
jgi:hypothetical protein